MEPVGPGEERERLLAVGEIVPMNTVLYRWVCADRAWIRWYVPGDSDPADDTVLAAVVEEALERVAPPAPELVTSPPLGAPVLTGLPMYVAVDDAAFSVHTGSVSAGPFTVTARIEPASIRFTPGDQHDAVVCRGPGTRWSEGDRPSDEDCTHTFTTTPADLRGSDGPYVAAVQVTYQASYTVEGPVLAGSYDLGTFDGPVTPVDVPVVERRAVRTTASAGG